MFSFMANKNKCSYLYQAYQLQLQTGNMSEWIQYNIKSIGDVSLQKSAIFVCVLLRNTPPVCSKKCKKSNESGILILWYILGETALYNNTEIDKFQFQTIRMDQS